MMGTIEKPRAVIRLMCLVATLTAVALAPGRTDAEGQPPDTEERSLAVYVGHSIVVDAPWPVARAAVTTPETADIQVLTSTSILVQGKAVGSTDLILWSEKEDIWRARVDVQVDLGQLQASLREYFPYSDLRLTTTQGVVVVEGGLRRAEHAAQLREILDATELTYVDKTHVSGIQQVQLRVRIAEVSRQALRLLGINAVITGSDAFIGSVPGSSGGGPLNPISIGVPAGTPMARILPFQFTQNMNVSSAVTLFGGFPNVALEVFIQALAENQYLRVLAEPTIIALSGEEASFLAGGEFPVPIVQGSSAGGGTSITVEYKEFGVRLRFLPTVLGDGRIRLHVAPEVSQTSSLNAVTIEGFEIPSLLTRRAETTLELNSGQTFAMAGLISRSENARSSRVPGLGDLPILGALFRSVRYQRDETDLVVMVTVSFVEPLSTGEDISDLPVPGSLHTAPNDWEFYAMGRLAGQTPVRLSEAQSAWLSETGLNRLRGAGAWATYDQAPAQSHLPTPRSSMPPEKQMPRNEESKGVAVETRLPP
ncbi:hypothetical protein LCGC14_0162300 [marine sediment metagenome]|uniref:Uncharacterized protein n=1 Tax=marine sediment metagenome TaxID=412755 RepID=A0A0F9UVB1_9ZZZZ|nr:type II and III secretion system protein family protein [Phycisphaerae bacterium]HDZ42478.1 type II and III secretion system protein family protein [Phycisphaerae bacterium]